MSTSNQADTPTLPPRVMRVVDDLSKRINQGRLQPGDQLPTLRELCRAFDVSYGVIHAALQRLERDGLIYKLHGSGTYVKDRRAVSSEVAPADRSTPRPRRSDVYILMHAMRAEFFTPLASLVCAIQDRGLIPIPVVFDRFQPEAVERLIGLWHATPPRAVLVRGATREVAETVQKHSPAATRFIVIYNLADGTSPHWHCVHPDEFEAYRLAAANLIQQGHRRIGLPVSIYEGMDRDAVQQFVVAKTAGIRKAFSDATLPDGLVMHDKHIPPSDVSGIGLTTENVLAMARWLSGKDRPDAIVENAYRMPCVLAAVREAGLRLGKDIEVVGVGDSTGAKQGEYPCVSEQFEEMARQVTEMIVNDDEDFDAVGRHVVVPPVFVPRWEPKRAKQKVATEIAS